MRAGLEIGGVFLSAYASQGLTNFYNTTTDATFKHKVTGASIVIWLNKTKSQAKKVVPPVIKMDTVRKTTPAAPVEKLIIKEDPIVKKDTAIKSVEEKINFVAKSIFFNHGSDQLTLESVEPLNEIADVLRANRTYKLTIGGHTDGTGVAEKNKILSQRRAESVKNYLIQQGVSDSRLTAIGYGSEIRIASDKTAEGRAANRRVELRLAE